MTKTKHRGIPKKQSSVAALGSDSFFASWSQKTWLLLLAIFFVVPPLLVVSGYTPDGRLFCTLYDLPKVNFIAAFIPLLGVFYGFYLYRNTSRIEVCSNFLCQNTGIKFFLLLLVAMAASISGSLVVKAGLYNLSIYALLGVLGFILAQLFLYNQLRWVAVYALLTALLIFTGLGIVQFFGYQVSFLMPIKGPASTFGYRNPAAHFIAMVLPFVLFVAGRHWRMWQGEKKVLQLGLFITFLLLAAAALLLLFMNHSRAAIMALLAEALVVPWFLFMSQKRGGQELQRRVRGWQLCLGTLLLVVVISSLIMAFPKSRQRVERSFNKFQGSSAPTHRY